MKRILSVFALVAAAAAPAAAQGRAPICPTGTTSEQIAANACELGVDLFRYMAPQLGTAVAGGNATLGQGGALGGIGHFAIGIRANGVFGSLPQIDGLTVAPGAATSQSYETSSQVVPMPVLDAAVGLFKGLPLGVTSVGGVDLLLNASYLPAFSNDQFDVELPDGSLKVGYGARIGLVQESLVSPGVSLTIMKRDLPTVDLTARPDPTTTIEATGLAVETTAWRLTASKNLLAFGLALGVGQDSYDFAGTATGSVTGGSASTPDLGFTMKRTNYFANVNLNIMLAKIVGEIGMVQGGDVDTFNTFDKKADASRMYGSVGFRIGL